VQGQKQSYLERVHRRHLDAAWTLGLDFFASLATLSLLALTTALSRVICASRLPAFLLPLGSHQRWELRVQHGAYQGSLQWHAAPWGDQHLVHCALGQLQTTTNIASTPATPSS